MTGADWLWSSGLAAVLFGGAWGLFRWTYGTWRWW